MEHDSQELKEVLRAVNLELPQILDTVNEKVPTLLKSLSDVLYGEENAKKYANAVAGFYSTLKQAGMEPEEAFLLTQQYMSSLNIGKTMGVGMREGTKGIRIKKVRQGEDRDDVDIDVDLRD